MRFFLILTIFIMSAFSFASSSEVRPTLNLPFTAEENYDGYLFIWYTFKVAGIEIPHIRTAEIPVSKNFKRVKKPDEFIIAWWPNYAVLLTEKTKTSYASLIPEGLTTLEELESLRGKAAFYEYIENEK